MASEAEAFDSGHQASEWKWLDLRSALRIPALLEIVIPKRRFVSRKRLL